MSEGAVKRKVRRDWAAILEAQAASGMMAGIYCRGHDIPYKTFMYHRRKVESSVGAPRTCALRPAPAFVPMHVSVAVASRAVLRISPGIVVECERLPEAGWLAELARHLSGGLPSC